MSRGNDKRQRIFDIYVANRNLLIDNNLITGDKNVYLCPICEEPYSGIDGKNPLTLEHAPPGSLGGKAKVLTCGACNNSAGKDIDFHLTERLRELDSASFLPNTETKVKIKMGDEILNATISIDENGKISIFHSEKNNHPVKLDEKLIGAKDGDIVDLNFLKTRVIPEKLEYALLKTAYILAFQKFGNALIFDPCFDIVREQLNNLDQRIYPERFWIEPPYPEEMEGVYFIGDEGLESLFVLFNLDTGNSIRKFGVFLPCPVNDIADVLDRLGRKFGVEQAFELEMFPWEQDGNEYLEDIDTIKDMFDWIAERKDKS